MRDINNRPYIFVVMPGTISINIICGMNKGFDIVPIKIRAFGIITLVDEWTIHQFHNSTILLPDDYVTIKYKSRRGEYATSAHDCCGGRIATFATNITLSVGALRNAVAYRSLAAICNNNSVTNICKIKRVGEIISDRGEKRIAV